MHTKEFVETHMIAEELLDGVTTENSVEIKRKQDELRNIVLTDPALRKAFHSRVHRGMPCSFTHANGKEGKKRFAILVESLLVHAPGDRAADDPHPRVFICVRGGNVESVYTEGCDDEEAVVIDFDNASVDSELSVVTERLLAELEQLQREGKVRQIA